MRSIYFAALLAITQAAAAPTDEAGAPDLLTIFDGDDSDYQVQQVDTSVTEIDYTVTQATNIHDNKDEKIEYVEFDWDNFTITEWDFSDLSALVESDEEFTKMKEALKAQIMARYNEEVANLPQVCEPGQKCRAEILKQLQLNIKNRLKTMLSEIKESIKQGSFSTRAHLKSAYTDAYYCDHGCECQFVENTYTYLLTQIADHEGKIAGWKSDINELQGRIGSVPYECAQQFNGIASQYFWTWKSMQEANDEQILALDDWTADGWDMDSAVDQEQFEAKFGFKYNSERFDTYYENEEYAEAVANLDE